MILYRTAQKYNKFNTKEWHQTWNIYYFLKNMSKSLKFSGSSCFSLRLLLETCRYILFASVLNVTHLQMFVDTDILISLCAVKQMTTRPDLTWPEPCCRIVMRLCHTWTRRSQLCRGPAPLAARRRFYRRAPPRCCLLSKGEKPNTAEMNQTPANCEKQRQVLSSGTVWSTLPVAALAPLVTLPSASEGLLLWLPGLGERSADVWWESGRGRAITCHVRAGTFSAANFIRGINNAFWICRLCEKCCLNRTLAF